LAAVPSGKEIASTAADTQGAAPDGAAEGVLRAASRPPEEGSVPSAVEPAGDPDPNEDLGKAVSGLGATGEANPQPVDDEAESRILPRSVNDEDK
jgi:hypothetical protein